MPNIKVVIVGLGNMGGAIAKGMLRAGVPAKHVWAITPRPKPLAEALGIGQSASFSHIPFTPHVVVVCVKPALVTDILQQDYFRHYKNVILSVAAGVPVTVLQNCVPAGVPVVRAMPNLGAMAGCSLTAMVSGTACSNTHRETAHHVAQSVGEVMWLENETLLHAVTAVSGSGPAYFFMLATCLQQQAEKFGFSPEQAEKLARHTLLAAGQVTQIEPASLQQFITQVSSPGGTTEAALAVLHPKLEGLVAKAIQAAWKRSKQLAAVC